MLLHKGRTTNRAMVMETRDDASRQYIQVLLMDLENQIDSQAQLLTNSQVLLVNVSILFLILLIKS